MNSEGHRSCITTLMNFYGNSKYAELKKIFNYFNTTCPNDNGINQPCIEHVQYGVMGADYPSSHKLSELVTVIPMPCFNPIFSTITSVISAWQHELPADMASRLYHFRHHSSGSGVSMMDDPITNPVLLGIGLIDPIYTTCTFLDSILTTCPACLGTGSGAVSMALGTPNNPFGDCVYCGGDGKVLEQIERVIEVLVGWSTGCPITTAFGVFPDLVLHRFQDARTMYTIHKTLSNLNRLVNHNNFASLVYLGYAIHFLQDVASIPHHVMATPYSSGHADYEEQDYNSIYNSISWDQVQTEYNRLQRYLQDVASSRSGTQTGALFRWVIDIVAGKSMSDKTEFRSTAVTLLAAVHHCLKMYLQMNEMATKPIISSVHVNYLRKSAAFLQPDIRKAASYKMPYDSSLPNKTQIKSAADAWLKVTDKAIKAKKAPPLMPRVLSKRKVIERQALTINVP